MPNKFLEYFSDNLHGSPRPPKKWRQCTREFDIVHKNISSLVYVRTSQLYEILAKIGNLVQKLEFWSRKIIT